MSVGQRLDVAGAGDGRGLRWPVVQPGSTAQRWLLACGVIGAALLSVVFTIEGAVRPGYDPWRDSINSLSLGPGGWVQRVNFVVYGLLVATSAVGWRAALVPGAGATWAPLLRLIAGLGYVVCGICSQDPAPGYPPGAAVHATPTLHGEIHIYATIVALAAPTAICLVLARRFAREPRWRGWATYSIVTILLVCAFMTSYGVALAHHGLAGLLEHLAGSSESLWELIFVARLLLGNGHVSLAGAALTRAMS